MRMRQLTAARVGVVHKLFGSRVAALVAENPVGIAPSLQRQPDSGIAQDLIAALDGLGVAPEVESSAGAEVASWVFAAAGNSGVLILVIGNIRAGCDAPGVGAARLAIAAGCLNCAAEGSAACYARLDPHWKGSSDSQG